MKNKNKIALVALLAGLPSFALAEVPADITGAITDATTVMTSMQTLVIAGVVFGLLIAFVKKRGKA